MLKSFHSGISRKEKHDQLIEYGGVLLEKQVCLAGNKILPLKIFKFKELTLATNGFNLTYYRKTTPWFHWFEANIDGVQVFINKPKSDIPFLISFLLNEFSIHSSIHHRNIIKLLGCCLDTSLPLFVFEFAPNSTLEDVINNAQVRLPWLGRLNIAIGIAEALAYLHHYGKTPIIHRDVNPLSVYLDEEYEPKLGGFSFAVSKPKDPVESSSIPVAGTYFYIDPDYRLTSILTEKIDVYSFGVLLLALFTWEEPGKYFNEELAITKFMSISQSLGLDLNDKDDRWLFDVIRRFTFQNVETILDLEGSEGATEEQLRAFLQLMCRCLKYSGELRPTMKEVVRELRRMIEQN